MTFLPYLLCRNCPAHILLPLPIQSETFPHQIAWPWGSLLEIFRCPSCGRLSRYTAEECQWHRVQSTDPHHTSKAPQLAVFRIAVPCAKTQCPGLLRILAVMPLRSRLEDAANLAGRTLSDGITCDRGCPNRGLLVDTAIQCTAVSVTAQGETLEWATED